MRTLTHISRWRGGGGGGGGGGAKHYIVTVQAEIAGGGGGGGGGGGLSPLQPPPSSATAHLWMCWKAKGWISGGKDRKSAGVQQPRYGELAVFRYQQMRKNTCLM